MQKSTKPGMFCLFSSTGPSLPASKQVPEDDVVGTSNFYTIKELSFVNMVACMVRCPPPEALNLQASVRSNAVPSNHPAEAFCSELDPNIFLKPPSKRLSVHIGGRVAMRRAWRSLFPPQPEAPRILRGPSGAPILPPGIVGSISHKDLYAVAVVTAGDPRFVSVGLDLERVTNDAHEKLGKKLLTANEQATLACSQQPIEDSPSGLPRELDVMLRFSFKEAVYKALHPWAQRYIAFHEAEVFPDPSGNAKIVLLGDLGAGDVHCVGRWLRFENYVLTAVRATRS
eukprot:gene24431-29531_t